MGNRNSNPLRLVVWALAGSALAASAFFLAWMPIHRFSPGGNDLWARVWAGRLSILVLFPPLIAGGGAVVLALRRLKRGVQDEVWTEGALAPARRLIEHSIWKWVALLIFGIGLILALSAPFGSGRFGLLSILLLPVQTVARLKQILALKAMEGSGLKDWKNFSPLQSAHWGKP